MRFSALIVLLLATSLRAQTPAPAASPAPPVNLQVILDQTEAATREMSALLRELWQAELQPPDQQSALVAELESKSAALVTRYAAVMTQPLPSFREWAQTDFSADLTWLGIQLEEIRLRKERAQEQLAKISERSAAKIWEQEHHLCKIRQALYEELYAALAQQAARGKKAEAWARLQQEGPQLREEIGRLELELSSLAAEALDPEILTLKKLWSEEKIRQAELTLETLQLQIQRATLQEQLFSPLKKNQDWKASITAEQATLIRLGKAQGLLLRRLEYFKGIQNSIKELAVLSTTKKSGGISGSGLTLPPKTEEKLALGNNLVDLATGEMTVAEQNWNEHQQLLHLLEARQELPSAPVVPAVKESGYFEKIRAKMAQAIQTVLTFVNSRMPKEESSRP